jgi:hypothetical protein
MLACSCLVSSVVQPGVNTPPTHPASDAPPTPTILYAHIDRCCVCVCLPAVGLVSSLVQRGVMTRPSQLAGSSAGSLIAASFNAGESTGGYVCHSVCCVLCNQTIVQKSIKQVGSTGGYGYSAMCRAVDLLIVCSNRQPHISVKVSVHSCCTSAGAHWLCCCCSYRCCCHLPPGLDMETLAKSHWHYCKRVRTLLLHFCCCSCHCCPQAWTWRRLRRATGTTVKECAHFCFTSAAVLATAASRPGHGDG